MERLAQVTPQALHAYRVDQAASVKLPYVVIGAALIRLAVLIGASKLPEIQAAAYRPGGKVRDSIWKHPNIRLHGVAASIFHLEQSRINWAVPAIYVTAASDDGLHQRALSQRATAVLTKTFQYDDLLNAIGRALRRSR
jgi:hypothetical protein